MLGNLTLTVRGSLPPAKTTWALVTTCPSLSQRNPDPDPVGISSRSDKENPREEPADRVVMRATAGDAR